MTRSRTLVAVAASLALACSGDSTTAPKESTAGTYHLTSYDGHALPTPDGPSVVITVDRSFGTPLVRCDTELLADTIRLADERFTHRRVSRLQCDDGRTPVTSIDDDAGTYSVRGDSVSLAISIPLDVPAGAPASRSILEYATRDGGSLVIGLTVTRTTGFFESTLFDPTELRYVRSP